MDTPFRWSLLEYRLRHPEPTDIAVLACALLGLAVAVGLARAVARGRRPPAPAWLILPLCCVWIGSGAELRKLALRDQVLAESGHDEHVVILGALKLAEAQQRQSVGLLAAGVVLAWSAGLLVSARRRAIPTITRESPPLQARFVWFLALLAVLALARGLALLGLGRVYDRVARADLEQARVAMGQVSMVTLIGLAGGLVALALAIGRRPGMVGRSTAETWSSRITAMSLALTGLVLGLTRVMEEPALAWTKEGLYRQIREAQPRLPTSDLPAGLIAPSSRWWSGPIALRDSKGWTLIDQNGAAPTKLPLTSTTTLTVALDPEDRVDEIARTRWLAPDPKTASHAFDQPPGLPVRTTLVLLASPSHIPPGPPFFRAASAATYLEGVHLDMVEQRVTDVAASNDGECILRLASPCELEDNEWQMLMIAGSAVPLPEGVDGLRLDPGPEAASLVAAAVRSRAPTAVLFVPDASWTVQDLVTLCLAAQGEGQRQAPDGCFACKLASRVPG